MVEIGLALILNYHAHTVGEVGESNTGYTLNLRLLIIKLIILELNS